MNESKAILLNEILGKTERESISSSANLPPVTTPIRDLTVADLRNLAPHLHKLPLRSVSTAVLSLKTIEERVRKQSGYI